MQNAVANILTTSNKIEFGFKYNKCKSMEEIDKSLPTLIIGYNIAKENISNFTLLRKSYPEQNIWWTYLKTEKRVDYDNDIIDFYNIIIDNITKNLKYSLIDIVNFSENEKKNVWELLLSNKNKLIYNHYNKFLFIYISDLKTVYGLPLTTCRFLGKNTDKLLEKLKKCEKNEFLLNFNNIPVEIRRKMDSDIHNLLVLNEYFC